MLKEFLLSAVRNLLKQKSYFLINTGGLAIGITCFSLIVLYVQSELSFDKFHQRSKDIYRVQMQSRMDDQTINRATTVAPMAKALLTEYPEVINITRVRRSGEWYMRKGEKKFNEKQVLFADSTFFEVFDFEFIAGNPKTALKDPKSVVLTETSARRYFDDENPLGQTLTIGYEKDQFTVTGLIKDIPYHSHMQFDIMGSISTLRFWNSNRWVNHNMYTYLTLDKQADALEFESKIQELIPKYVGPAIEEYYGVTLTDWLDQGNLFEYYLMPLEDIHLNSHVSLELEVNGSMKYLYFYILIAIIILFVALINYVNLATAQSISRAKEVCIKKIIGSGRRRLVFLFLTESVLTSILAALIALILVVTISPYFTETLGIAYQVSTEMLSWNILFLFLLSVVVGLIAGIYPAILLTSFQPIQVLKGRFKTGKIRAFSFRNLLVTIQLTASMVIMIGTIVVYQQINFMLNKELGFQKDQILVIRRSDVLQNKLETFKTQLKSNPNIQLVANSRSIPGKSRYHRSTYMPENRPSTPFFLHSNRVSFDYAELMGFKLTAGRFFSKAYASDSSAVIINEAAARSIGLDNPIGSRLISKNRLGNISYLEIIGVIKDYNIESLHHEVEPTILKLMPGNWEGFLTIKCQSTENLDETLDFVEASWSDYTNDKPFEYFFFDEDYAQLYYSESITAKLFGVFSALSLLITSLGLVGLITFSVAIRKKEICTRKVLGASMTTLIRLLSHEMVKLILVSTLMAWPFAYFASNYWLQNFSDKLNVSPWIYVSSTFAVLFIGCFAISFQTIKASLSNPVDALRQE